MYMGVKISEKIESVDRGLDKVQYPYLFVVGIVHFLYFMFFLGVIRVDQTYLHTLSVILQSFIVIFLLYRFHPFGNRYILKPVDKTIIFGSALLLGTNLFSVEFAQWLNPLETETKKITSSILNGNNSSTTPTKTPDSGTATTSPEQPPVLSTL